MVAIDDSTAQDHYIGCMVMPPSRATSQVPAKTAAAAGGGTSAAAVANEDVVTCLATMRLKDAVVVYVSCERVVFMMSQGVAGDELPPLTLKRTLMVEEIEAVRTLAAVCVRSCCGSDMCVCVRVVTRRSMMGHMWHCFLAHRACSCPVFTPGQCLPPRHSLP